MSVTLEDASRAPWVETGIVKNYTPADEKEIEEVRQIFHELARELAEHPHGHYAGGSVSSFLGMREKNNVSIVRGRSAGGNMLPSDEEIIIVRQLSDEEYNKIVEEFYKEYSHKPFRRRGEQKLSRTPPEMRQSTPKPREVKREMKNEVKK